MQRIVIVMLGAVVVASCSSPRDGASRPEPRPPAAMAGDANARAAAPDANAIPAADGNMTAMADGNTGGADASTLTSAITIVDAPMKWSAERERLTLEYRRLHSDPAASDITIEPRVIVLHYTAGGSAKGTRNYFDNPRIESGRKTLAKAGAVNVSSHYVIDRDGTIYRLQPETRFARHCIGLNHVAIGIENVGDEAKWPLTEAQVTANAALVRDLVARFPSITHLLGHHEVMGFKQHPYYLERDPNYGNQKPDPGVRFMTAVRERVADLKLSGLSS